MKLRELLDVLEVNTYVSLCVNVPPYFAEYQHAIDLRKSSPYLDHEVLSIVPQRGICEPNVWLRVIVKE